MFGTWVREKEGTEDREMRKHWFGWIMDEKLTVDVRL
jgi:hypothetical protein